MRKNLKRAALAETKRRPGKTGAMPQEPYDAVAGDTTPSRRVAHIEEQESCLVCPKGPE